MENTVKITCIAILRSSFTFAGRKLWHTATEIFKDVGGNEVWEYGSKAAGKRSLLKRASGRHSDEEIVTMADVNEPYDTFIANLKALCEDREWGLLRTDYAWTDEHGFVHRKTINCQEVCLDVAKNYMKEENVKLMIESMNATDIWRKIAGVFSSIPMLFG